MRKCDDFVKKCASLRGSVLMIGPLLGRYGKAVVAKPGGDKIGRRRLDTHFLGFGKLGAEFQHLEGRNVYELRAEKLKGCYMLLDEASVTGTANVIMAAVMAEGETTIYNAACEPYLQQLCRMLNSMGANITGIGSNLLKIQGVKSLHGCHHRVLPDMIEVGSFIGGYLQYFETKIANILPINIFYSKSSSMGMVGLALRERSAKFPARAS